MITTNISDKNTMNQKHPNPDDKSSNNNTSNNMKARSSSSSSRVPPTSSPRCSRRLIISFQFILATFFCILCLFAWGFPILAATLFGKANVDHCLTLLLKQTGDSISINLQRQFSQAATIALATRNFTRNHGLPYSSNQTLRLAINRNIGDASGAGFRARNTHARRYYDGSKSLFVGLSEEVFQLQLCQTNGIMNLSLTPAQQKAEVEEMYDCYARQFNISDLEFSPQVPRADWRPSGSRFFVNATNWYKFQDLLRAEPNHMFFYEELFYTPQYRNPLNLLIFTTAFFPAFRYPNQPWLHDQIMFYGVESFTYGGLQELLSDLLPRRGGEYFTKSAGSFGGEDNNAADSKSFLVGSHNIVLAMSEPNSFYYTLPNGTNISAPPYNTRPCFERNEQIACVYSIDEYKPFSLLKEVGAATFRLSENASALSHDEFIGNSVEDPTQDFAEYYWFRRAVQFSHRVYFTLYVFIPTDLVMGQIYDRSIDTFVVSGIILVLGFSATYMLLRPIVGILEELSEKMAKNPFDKSLLEMAEKETAKTTNTISNNENSTIIEEVNDDNEDTHSTTYEKFTSNIEKHLRKTSEISNLFTSFHELIQVIHSLRSFLPERKQDRKEKLRLTAERYRQRRELFGEDSDTLTSTKENKNKKKHKIVLRAGGRAGFFSRPSEEEGENKTSCRSSGTDDSGSDDAGAVEIVDDDNDEMKQVNESTRNNDENNNKEGFVESKFAEEKVKQYINTSSNSNDVTKDISDLSYDDSASTNSPCVMSIPSKNNITNNRTCGRKDQHHQSLFPPDEKEILEQQQRSGSVSIPTTPLFTSLNTPSSSSMNRNTMTTSKHQNNINNNNDTCDDDDDDSSSLARRYDELLDSNNHNTSNVNNTNNNNDPTTTRSSSEQVQSSTRGDEGQCSFDSLQQKQQHLQNNNNVVIAERKKATEIRSSTSAVVTASTHNLTNHNTANKKSVKFDLSSSFLNSTVATNNRTSAIMSGNDLFGNNHLSSAKPSAISSFSNHNNNSSSNISSEQIQTTTAIDRRETNNSSGETLIDVQHEISMAGTDCSSSSGDDTSDGDQVVRTSYYGSLNDDDQYYHVDATAGPKQQNLQVIARKRNAHYDHRREKEKQDEQDEQTTAAAHDKTSLLPSASAATAAIAKPLLSSSSPLYPHRIKKAPSSRFLVAVIRSLQLSSSKNNITKNNENNNENHNNRSKNDTSSHHQHQHQKLLDDTCFFVDKVYHNLITPTGAHLIEYRNDFFILALRLSEKKLRSRLAQRFVKNLMMLADEMKARDENNNTGDKQKENYHRIYLTAGLSVGTGRSLRVDAEGEEEERQQQQRHQNNNNETNDSSLLTLTEGKGSPALLHLQHFHNSTSHDPEQEGEESGTRSSIHDLFPHHQRQQQQQQQETSSSLVAVADDDLSPSGSAVVPFSSSLAAARQHQQQQQRAPTTTKVLLPLLLRPFSLLGPVVTEAVEAELVIRTHLDLTYDAPQCVGKKTKKRIEVKTVADENESTTTTTAIENTREDTNTSKNKSKSKRRFEVNHQVDNFISHAICYKCNQTQDALVLPCYFLPTSLINVSCPRAPSHKMIQYRECNTSNVDSLDATATEGHNKNNCSSLSDTKNRNAELKLGVPLDDDGDELTKNNTSWNSTQQHQTALLPSSPKTNKKVLLLKKESDLLPTASSAVHRFVRPVAHTVVIAEDADVDERGISRELVFPDVEGVLDGLIPSSKKTKKKKVTKIEE